MVQNDGQQPIGLKPLLKPNVSEGLEILSEIGKQQMVEVFSFQLDIIGIIRRHTEFSFLKHFDRQLTCPLSMPVKFIYS